MFTIQVLSLRPIFASFAHRLMLPALMAVALSVAAEAQAGLIVSVQVDGPGMSAAQRQTDSSCAERAGAAENHLLDLSGGAVPASSGSSSSPSNAVTASAVLTETCGVPLVAFCADLCEERAWRLPDSPFFDHLRPPRG